jgi:enamine deaminase RidA (YjgF/YER057c/UK114 family)
MERRQANPPTVPDTLRYGFSQAVTVRGGTRVHLSGQVGVDAQERTAGPGLEEQTEAAIQNIARVLESLGGDLTHVVMLRIYLVQSATSDQRFIGQALRRHFSAQPPATSWVHVSGLAEPEWLVEIEAEAALPD